MAYELFEKSSFFAKYKFYICHAREKFHSDVKYSESILDLCEWIKLIFNACIQLYDN